MSRKNEREKVQGEGNREADRNYREAAKEYAESGDVSEAAREAVRELEAEEDPPEEKGR